jgi:hypothetical protein
MDIVLKNTETKEETRFTTESPVEDLLDTLALIQLFLNVDISKQTWYTDNQ